jgi:hypothetical protein
MILWWDLPCNEEHGCCQPARNAVCNYKRLCTWKTEECKSPSSHSLEYWFSISIQWVSTWRKEKMNVTRVLFLLFSITVYLTSIPPSPVSEFHTESQTRSRFPILRLLNGRQWARLLLLLYASIATVSEVCYGLDAALDMRNNHWFKFRLGLPARRQVLQMVPFRYFIRLGFVSSS